MEKAAPVSVEEFRKLKMQVDIIQRFLTKTFGSSFLDFFNEAQLLKVTNGKSLKVSDGLANSGVSKTEASAPVENGGGGKAASSKNAIRRPPPPLLHRPPGASTASVARTSDVTFVEVEEDPDTVEVEEQEEEYYEDGNEEEDVAAILQPETVFSDEEGSVPIKKQNDTRKGSFQKMNGNRPALKRDHSAAFGYDETEILEQEQGNVNLPEGTDCIIIDSDEQEQNENYEFLADEVYENGQNEDLYGDEEYTYGEDGLDMQMTGNLQIEDLQTDGNVTFGTLITSSDTGIQHFQCAFCPSPKVFKHKQSLKEHYLLNHSPIPPAFQCQCGRRFLKLSQLKRHEVVHTAERPFVCPICHKDFTRKDNMTVHMVRNHAEKKHPCPYCPDKVYATPAEVNRHLRLYHSQWKQ